jgi:hypothetical protein
LAAVRVAGDFVAARRTGFGPGFGVAAVISASDSDAAAIAAAAFAAAAIFVALVVLRAALSFPAAVVLLFVLDFALPLTLPAPDRPASATDLLEFCLLDFAVNEAASAGAFRRFRSGQIIAAHFSHYTETYTRSVALSMKKVQ